MRGTRYISEHKVVITSCKARSPASLVACTTCGPSHSGNSSYGRLKCVLSSRHISTLPFASICRQRRIKSRFKAPVLCARCAFVVQSLAPRSSLISSILVGCIHLLHLDRCATHRSKSNQICAVQGIRTHQRAIRNFTLLAGRNSASSRTSSEH